MSLYNRVYNAMRSCRQTASSFFFLFSQIIIIKKRGRLLSARRQRNVQSLANPFPPLGANRKSLATEISASANDWTLENLWEAKGANSLGCICAEAVWRGSVGGPRGRELQGGGSTSVMREVSNPANKWSGMILTQKYVYILNSICGNYNILFWGLAVTQ